MWAENIALYTSDLILPLLSAMNTSAESSFSILIPIIQVQVKLGFLCLKIYSFFFFWFFFWSRQAFLFSGKVWAILECNCHWGPKVCRKLDSCAEPRAELAELNSQKLLFGTKTELYLAGDLWQDKLAWWAKGGKLRVWLVACGARGLTEKRGKGG